LNEDERYAMEKNINLLDCYIKEVAIEEIQELVDEMHNKLKKKRTLQSRQGFFIWVSFGNINIHARILNAGGTDKPISVVYI